MADLIPASIKDVSTEAYNEMLEKLSDLDLSSLLVYVIDRVDASALPALIDQFHVSGVEGATLAETDANRRELVKNSIAIHRGKGTPGAVRRAISAAGFGDSTVYERPGDLKYDGVRHYDGLSTYGQVPGQWVTYHVILSRAVTNDQAQLIRELCDEFAPARCRLLQLVYTAAAIRYNGTARYDGSYNHGIA